MAPSSAPGAPAPARPWRDAADLSDAGLIALPLLALLLIGGVRLSSWSILAAMALALAALAWRASGLRAAPALLGLAAAVGAAGVLLPLLPLPGALADALCSSCAAPAAGPDGWRPLHAAPARGAAEAVRWAACAAFAAAAWLRAGTERGRRVIAAAVLLAPGAAAVLGLLGTGVGTRLTLVGRGVPAFDGGLLLPVVNPNHQASVLGIGLVFGVGLLLQRRPDEPRWIAPAAAATAVSAAAGLVVTGSRGGMAATIPALAYLGLVAARRGARPAAAVFVGLLAAAAATARALANELSQGRPDTLETYGHITDNVRWQLWSDSLGLLADRLVLGTGVGGFVDVLPRYQTQRAFARYVWAENSWLQLVLDRGVLLGGLAIVAALGLLAVALARGWQRRRPAAAAALLFVAGHEAVGFAAHVVLVAWLVALLLALALPSPERAPRGRRWLALAAAVLVAGLAAALVPATDEKVWLAELAAQPERVDAFADAADRRLPQSFPTALAVARAHAAQDRGGDALTWLNRAQFLAPRSPYPHLETGRVLGRAGAVDQALGEYRLALIDSSLQLVGAVIAETRRLEPPAEVLARLAPATEGPDATRFAVEAWMRGHPGAVAHARTVNVGGPDEPWGLVLAMLLASHDADRARVDALIGAIEAQQPLLDFHAVTLGRLLVREGRLELAESLLAPIHGSGRPDAAAAAMELARLEIARDDLDTARALLGVARREPRVATHAWYELARIEQKQGQPAAALRAAQASLRSSPTFVEAALLAAELLTDAGRPADAAQVLQSTADRLPDRRLLKALDALP